MIKVAPEDVAELPIDELGLLVLQDMVNSREWNEHNYLNRYDQSPEYRALGSAFPKSIQAIAEATGWLRANAMITRKPGDNNSDSIIVTRRGHVALETGLDGVRALSRIESSLHPLLERKVRRQFLLGEYETGIFTALKQVEVRVRRLGGYGDDVIGVKLMTAAFKAGGPLADPEAEGGEVTGMMQLFCGAYAVLRNPSAHREVSFDDVALAADAVMTASLLMRILDAVEVRLAA